MELRYALLALLIEGETHGYALVKRFALRLGPHWHPNIGQIYHQLRSLERQGLVIGRDELHLARLRRLFRVTPRGERALGQWLGRRPSWPGPVRDEMLVRLLAAGRRGTAAVAAQLDRHEAEYERYVASVRDAVTRLDDAPTRRLAHEAALVHAEAHLRWLARCREVLVGERRSLAS
jgi:DNA-binding PadR family transcriptional regulator